MDHERDELRTYERKRGHGTITRIYREDPEACAEAVLYVLKMRPPAGRFGDPEAPDRAEVPGETE